MTRSLVSASIAALSWQTCAVDGDAPVGIIFDTDMGNDIDDALALAMLHALHDRAECRLLAVTSSKDNPYSAQYIDVVNTFYGHGDVPIGTVQQGVTPADGAYTRPIVEAAHGGKPVFPRTFAPGSFQPAVPLMRQILAAQPDDSAAIVQVGFSTNVAQLLESAPDAASPLTGLELVRRKVRVVSVMAGAFTEELVEYREYNVVEDIPSAQYLFEHCPVPIVVSGYEIGREILFPASGITSDFDWAERHPVREGYERYMKMPYDRPTWDLTSVLYAVRPDAGYFQVSTHGTVHVHETGETSFEESPEGMHHYLKIDVDAISRVSEALELLASQPPAAKR